MAAMAAMTAMISFKVSVRLQGGPKRAAHAAARARASAPLTLHGRRATRPSAGVENPIGPPRRQDQGRGRAITRIGRRPIRPARRPGRAATPDRGASYGRRVTAAAARIVSGPPLQAQGRFASQATALRAALDLGASATLGQAAHRAGRWPALSSGRAPPHPSARPAPGRDSRARTRRVADAERRLLVGV